MSPGDLVTTQAQAWGIRDSSTTVLQGTFLPRGMVCLVLKREGAHAEVMDADQVIWTVPCAHLNLVRRKYRQCDAAISS